MRGGISPLFLLKVLFSQYGVGKGAEKNVFQHRKSDMEAKVYGESKFGSMEG